MGILTNLGILENGQISKKARDKFVEDVKFLIGNGNDGSFWIAPLEPFFPPFGPAPDLENQEKYPIFHKVFIDTLYQKTAVAFDVNGATPLFPVADPGAFAVQLGIPLPDISLEKALSIFPVPTPQGILELLEVSVSDIPDILANLANIKVPPMPAPPGVPPIPSPNAFLPDVSLPSGLGFSIPPSIPFAPFPNFPVIPPPVTFDIHIPSILGFLTCLFSKLPLMTIAVIANSDKLLQALPKGPPGIVLFFAAIVVALILDCLAGLAINLFLSLIAAIVVYMKNLIIMLLLAMIASIIGDGIVVKGMADFLGLV